MRRLTGLTIALVSILPLAAYGQTSAPAHSDSEQASDQSPSAATQGAPAPAPASAPQTPPSNVAVATAEEHEMVESEVEKHFRRLGYTPVKKNGRQFYCRGEAELGTRLKRPTCISEEAAKQRREDARRAMEERFGQRRWTEAMLAGGGS